MVRPVARLECHRAPQRADGLVEPLQVLQHLAEVVPRLPLARCHGHERTQDLLGRLFAVGEAQRVRVVVVEAERGGARRSEPGRRGLEQIDRELDLAAIGEDRSEDLGGAAARTRRSAGPAGEPPFRGRQVTSLMSVGRAGQHLVERGTQRLAP